jgi:hypothetical protein
MEPASDDELVLMGEVESLECELQKTGCPVKQQNSAFFYNNLQGKELKERLK